MMLKLCRVKNEWMALGSKVSLTEVASLLVLLGYGFIFFTSTL